MSRAEPRRDDATMLALRDGLSTIVTDTTHMLDVVSLAMDAMMHHSSLSVGEGHHDHASQHMGHAVNGNVTDKHKSMSRAMEACADFVAQSASATGTREGTQDTLGVVGEAWGASEGAWGCGWMDLVVAREEAARFKRERDDARGRLSKVRWSDAAIVGFCACVCACMQSSEPRRLFDACVCWCVDGGDMD